MIPSIFIPLSLIPTLPNGKTDRKALPSPSQCRPNISARYSLPQTDTEIKLASIWKQVLGLDSIGIDDPFLELGGDSLLAEMVTSRIGDVFDITISLVDVLNIETIRDIAQLIEHRQYTQSPKSYTKA